MKGTCTTESTPRSTRVTTVFEGATAQPNTALLLLLLVPISQLRYLSVTCSFLGPHLCTQITAKPSSTLGAAQMPDQVQSGGRQNAPSYIKWQGAVKLYCQGS